MNVWNTFTEGLKSVIRNKKMWFLLFGIQFAFALFLLIPLRSQWDKMLGHSLMGQEVVQGFGANVFFEFLYHFRHAVSLEMVLLFIMGIAYLTVTIFLNGGILSTFLREDEKFSARHFFEGSGYYFGRFVRLFLFSIVFLIVVFLINKGIGLLFSKIYADSEPLWAYLQILKLLIFFVLIFLVNMVFDYAKIRTILLDRRDMFKTGLRAWAFVFRHLGKTLALYYLVALLGIIFFIVYTATGKLIHASTSIGILLLFLWQQTYAFTRIGVRLTFYSSQAILFKKLTEPYLKAWFKEDTG